MSRVCLVSFYEYIQRYSYDSSYKPEDPVSTKVRTVYYNNKLIYELIN